MDLQCLLLPIQYVYKRLLYNWNFLLSFLFFACFVIGDKRSQSIVSDHKNELIQYSEDQTKCMCLLFVNGRVRVEVVQIKCLAECPTMSETLVPSVNIGGRMHLAIYASFRN